VNRIYSPGELAFGNEISNFPVGKDKGTSSDLFTSHHNRAPNPTPQRIQFSIQRLWEISGPPGCDQKTPLASLLRFVDHETMPHRAPKKVKKPKTGEVAGSREAQLAEQRRRELASRSILSRLQNRSSERK